MQLFSSFPFSPDLAPLRRSHFRILVIFEGTRSLHKLLKWILLLQLQGQPSRMGGHLNVGPPTLFAALLLHAGVNEPFQTHKKCPSRSREVEKEMGRAVLGALNKKYFLQHVHKMSNYTGGGGGGRRGGFSEGKRASRTFLFANSEVKLGFAVMGMRGFAVIHEARCSHAALMRREEGRLEEQ